MLPKTDGDADNIRIEGGKNGILMRANNLSALTQCPTRSKTCHSMVQCNLKRKNVEAINLSFKFVFVCFIGFIFTDYYGLI